MNLATLYFDMIHDLPAELKLLILQKLTDGEKMLCWMVSRSWRQWMKIFWPKLEFDSNIILDHSATIGSEKLAIFAMKIGANNLETSFLRASGCNQLNILKLLKTRGEVSVILWRSGTYQAAFNYASAGGHIKIMIWLKNRDQHDDRKKKIYRSGDAIILDYRQSLVWAAESGHYDALKLIMEWLREDLTGYDLNTRLEAMQRNYDLAIIKAEENGHTKCSHLLINDSFQR